MRFLKQNQVIKFNSWIMKLGLWISVCFTVLNSSQTLANNTFVLEPGIESWYLGEHIRFLEDAEGGITIDQIISGEYTDQFQKHTSRIANFGFTGHAYWFEISLTNRNPDQIDWYLGVEYSLLDYIDLYFQGKDGELVHRETGDRREFSTREIKHRYFYFGLPLEYNETRTFYLRVQSEGSAEIPIVLKTPRYFAAVNHEQQFGQGLFVGLMLIMIIYNLALAIGSRQVEYLLYTIFVSSLLIFKGTMNGITHEYLWPDLIWWANAASAFSTPMVFLTACLYGWKFLSVKDYKKMNVVYFVAITILGLASLGSFVLPYIFIKASTILGMLSAFMLAITSFYIYKKGFRPALFFFLSFILLIVGSLIYGFQKLGVIPVSFITVYCIEITSSLQAILLAIGQSDKINQINKAIRKAQRAALEAQIETNRVTEMMKNKLEILVEERTADLWEKSQELRVMMDSLKQGLCTIDEDLRISGEYSQYLEQILGQEQLGNKSIKKLVIDRMMIGSDSCEQLATSIKSMVGESVLNFEANEHVFPRSVKASLPNGERCLELDWVPIENQHEDVSKVMLAIRDVTEIQEMKQEAANREHELKIISQIIRLNASKFQNFIKASYHLIDNCRSIIDDGEFVNQWDVILRYIHTIKGNARTYGFEEIAQTVHEAEDYVFDLDRQNLTQEQLTNVMDNLKNIEAILDRYKYLNDVKLERISAGATEATMMEVNVFLKKLARDGVLKQYQSDPNVVRVIQKVQTLTSDTFRGAIRPLIDSLPSLAKQLGKRAPKVIFEGEDFDIERRVGEKYEDIFVHLIRNTMDHGFLPHHEGEITISMVNEEKELFIYYKDSGRGLNLRKLRMKGLEKGVVKVDASDQELAELVFHSGISSSDHVTDISGRGIGMDAVKAFVAQLGGNIAVELLDEPSDPGFRLFRFKLTIPVPIRNILDLAS